MLTATWHSTTVADNTNHWFLSHPDTVPESSSDRTPDTHYAVQEMRRLRHTFFKSPKLKLVIILPPTCSASTLQSRVLGFVSWETRPFHLGFRLSSGSFFLLDLHTHSFGDSLHFYDFKFHPFIGPSQIHIFRLNLLLISQLPVCHLGRFKDISK